mmetsp:Transcript_7831/g.19510  ORF Transcript_7831/g.19510 Transcript_7831/m.19510 type:complete len:407 (+) Transcript_7831:470-1690(+)
MDGQQALHAVDVLAARLQQQAQRVVDLVQVHGPLQHQRHAGHLVVVVLVQRVAVPVALVAAVRVAAVVAVRVLVVVAVARVRVAVAVVVAVLVLVALVAAVLAGALVAVMAVAGMRVVVVVLVALMAAVGPCAVVAVLMVVVVVVVVLLDLAVAPERDIELLLHVLQVEAAHPQHVVHRHLGALRARDVRHLVDGAQPPLQHRQILGRHQVGLVEDDAVRVRDLRHRLVHHVLLFLVVQVAHHVLGVNHRHHAVQPHLVGQRLVHVEGGDDGSGVGQARGLDHDVVKLSLAVVQAVERLDEVVAHGAAQAAVGQLHHGVARALHRLLLHYQLAVNVDLAKLVLNHSNAAAVVLGENVVQQGRLASTQEAGDNSNGDAGVLCLLSILCDWSICSCSCSCRCSSRKGC